MAAAPAPASAANLYVDDTVPAGTDAGPNPCTAIATPCKTIPHAIGQGGAVSSAKIADGAVTEAKVADAVLPRAIAYVDDAQAIVPANSFGVGSATATLEATFVCFNGLPFTPTNIQVTVARGGGSLEAVAVNAFEPGNTSFCAGAEQASVQFFDTDTDTPDATPPGFYTTFFD